MRKLFFTLVLSLMTLTSNAQLVRLGDLNRDNQVNITDIMTLVDIVLHGYSPFSITPAEVTMQTGGTALVTIDGGYYYYEVESANPNIVEASLNDMAITLTAFSVGETYVTVKDVLTFRTIVIPVFVILCPDNHHPHLIDLGLPSGTKWACCNVGADKPEAYGGYYAWGETEEKNVYDWSTYIHCDGNENTCHDLGSDIAGTQYDVAHVRWGGSWIMPSKEQRDELISNCTYEWTTVNGVKGGKFTSKNNGGSIFLPAAGYRNNSGLDDVGLYGNYWSSTQHPSRAGDAYNLVFDSGSTYWYNYYRGCGFGVRPVVRN